MNDNYKTFTNKKQWEMYIRNILKQNDKALIRALMIIYDLQTEKEKNLSESVEDNNEGFNKLDATRLSKIAEKVNKKENLLSIDILMLRALMPKYWRQIMIRCKANIAKEKEEQEIKEIIKAQEEEDAKKIKLLEDCLVCPCEYGICDECRLQFYNEILS